MRIFVSSGEVSGDIAGARLIAEIRHRHPEVGVFGVGGGRMSAAGATIDVLTNHLGTVGITEVFANLPPLIRSLFRIRRRLQLERPDVAVLIANDLFNALLARWLKRAGIPTVAYFPPQVWIWRSLARPLARGYDVVLASFPEEHAVYQQACARTAVIFVGHYLAEALHPVTPAERADARRSLGISEATRVVALMPGSRRHEIHVLGPVLLGAARLLVRHDGALHFVLPAAEPGYRETLESLIHAHQLSSVVSLTEDSYEVMRAADLLLVASGTVTLEASLLGVPMVVIYKVSPLTYRLIRASFRMGLLESMTVSLPNLILKRPAVPELLQKEATPDLVAAEAWAILSDPVRQREIRSALSEVATRVSGVDCMQRAAAAICHLASGSTTKDLWPQGSPACPLPSSSRATIDASVGEAK